MHNKLNMLKYTCAHCGACFVRKDDYKRHQITHTNHRPWSCPYCHLYFKTKQACSKHIKIHATKLDDYKNHDNVIGPMTQLLNFHNPYDYYNFVDPLQQPSFIPEQHPVSYGPPEPLMPTTPQQQQPVYPQHHEMIPPSDHPGSQKIMPLSVVPSGPLNSVVPLVKSKEKKKKENEKKKKTKTKSNVKVRKSSNLVQLSDGDIDELASIKQVTRNEPLVSMSERYLIDCSKEKITGQKSHKSTVEIGRAAPGSHVCRECNKAWLGVFLFNIFFPNIYFYSIENHGR